MSRDGIPQAGPQFASLLLKPAASSRRRALLVAIAVAVCHLYFLTLLMPVEVEDPNPTEELAIEELNLVNEEVSDGGFRYNLLEPPTVIPPPPGFGVIQVPNSTYAGINQYLDSVSGNARSAGGIWSGPQDPALDRGLRWLALHSGGGHDQAVTLGLHWLARHQAPSGRWGMHDFSKYVGCNCSGCGLERDPTAATALALLPFLGIGETHKPAGRSRSYQAVVERGLRHLLQQQREDGRFGGPFAHALATWALCEAYGLTADPALKGPAQRAANALVAAQHSQGGWTYTVSEPFDLELTGWNVMALKSAIMAGLTVPNATWRGVGDYLDGIATDNGSFYGSRALTPIGLHCRVLLGWGPRNPALARGIARLTEKAPGDSQESIVTLYHAHQVAHHFGHRDDSWDKQARELLAADQDQGSIRCQKGSWAPAQDWAGKRMGRLGTTALALLVLEYNRSLPSYPRRELGAIKDEAIRDSVK